MTCPFGTTLLNFFVRADVGHGPKPQPSYQTRTVCPRNGKPFSNAYYPMKEYEEASDGRKVRKAWDADKWRNRIIERTRAEVAAQGLGEPIKGPIRCDLDFYFPRPGYMLDLRKYPACAILYDLDKNDRDNLDKLFLDAITQSGWYVDSTTKEEVKRPLVWHGDGQVCRGEISRSWCALQDGHQVSGVRVVIASLSQPTVQNALAFAPKEVVHPRELLAAGRPKAGVQG